jgi:hypoxanthine phosphoribosyltransferase
MVTCRDKQFELFLSSVQIQDRIKALATKINQEYKDKKPVFIAILNGVYRFAGDVFNYIDIDCEISFVKLRSYVGMESGELTTMLGLDTALEGREVILLEDIVDTGKTIYHFLPELKKSKPASIKIMTLLVKPEAAQYDIPLEFVGFSVPNYFLLGYGLDYDGLGRHYNDIYKVVETPKI